MARLEYGHQKIEYTIINQPHRPFSDLYHLLMRGNGMRILLFAVCAYLFFIGLFAVLFFIGGDCVEGARPGSFQDDFWFSVQTFSTIGYGGMLPKTIYAHVLVTMESFVGLAGVAMMTALMYSRFSRPMARVGFSDNLAISTHNGVPTLQLRIANERDNRLFDSRVQLHVLVETSSEEGVVLRRQLELPLVQSETPMFMLNRTLIHRLDAESALHGLSPDNVAERVVFILASFTGTDDALMQSVYAQRLYSAEDLMFNHKFADMLEQTPEGFQMRYDNLSALVAE
ncbi:MAG: inward rectifier potassium channel [Myxococcota bacterium]|jgi:inward rectifier potassium channel